jgi:hypothetical protein
MKLFLLPPILSITYPPKSSTLPPLLSVSSRKNQTTKVFEPSGALVGLILDPSTLISSNFVLNNVSSWVIAIRTWGLNVLMLQAAGFNLNAGVHLHSEILLLPPDSQPYHPSSHMNESSACPRADVSVNPVSTNGLSLTDSAEKKFMSIWCRSHPRINSTRSPYEKWHWHMNPGGFGPRHYS